MPAGPTESERPRVDLLGEGSARGRSHFGTSTHVDQRIQVRPTGAKALRIRHDMVGSEGPWRGVHCYLRDRRQQRRPCLSNHPETLLMMMSMAERIHH